MENLKKRNNKLFLALIVVAFYLRLQGINYGLPYVVNSSEANNLIQVANLFRNLPSYLINSEGINIGPLYLLLSNFVALITTHTVSFVNVLEINVGSLLVPLRFLSVLFGLLSIIVVYFVALRFNTFVALVSSGLLSVSMIHVRFSQVFLPFSAVTFFGLLSLYFAIKSSESEKNILLSAYSILVSFLMHPIGIMNAIPLLFVLLQQKIFLKYKNLFLKIFIIGLLLNLSFFVYLPDILLNYVKGYFFYHSNTYFLYACQILLVAIGPIAYFSLLFFLKYKNDHDLNLIKVLSSFLFIYIGFLGFVHFTGSEYSMLFIPYFCIFAALFFNSIFQRVKTNGQQFGFILLMLLLFWIPLKGTLKYNKINTLADTRVEATEWIKQNTSEDYKISWDKNSIQTNWHDAYNIRTLRLLVSDPEVLISKQKFPVTYKLLKEKNWFKTLKRKVDYVVINSFDYEQTLRQPGNNLEKKYYKQLCKLKPTITFNPYLKELEKTTGTLLIEDLNLPLLTLWQRERSGPVIKVYKL